MPKNKDRYEIHLNGEFYAAKKTRRSANMIAATLSGDVEIKDTDPPKKKIKGEGFVMEQEVVDPYETDKTKIVKRAPSRNLVETMHRRGQITLQQFSAAENFYHGYMVTNGYTNMAMDYEKERVDSSGSSGNGAVEFGYLIIMMQYKDARKKLSKLEIYRLEHFLIHGMTLRQYCLKVFKTDNTRRQKEESQALKQSLTKLAVLWGYENGPRAKEGINKNVA